MEDDREEKIHNLHPIFKSRLWPSVVGRGSKKKEKFYFFWHSHIWVGRLFIVQKGRIYFLLFVIYRPTLCVCVHNPFLFFRYLYLSLSSLTFSGKKQAITTHVPNLFIFVTHSLIHSFIDSLFLLSPVSSYLLWKYNRENKKFVTTLDFSPQTYRWPTLACRAIDLFFHLSTRPFSFQYCLLRPVLLSHLDTWTHARYVARLYNFTQFSRLGTSTTGFALEGPGQCVLTPLLLQPLYSRLFFYLSLLF